MLEHCHGHEGSFCLEDGTFEHHISIIYVKVSQYLRNTLAGTSVFLGFQSMHSQYLQFNFMLSISKCSCSVFQNVHAVYLGFENTVSISVCALS